MFIPEYKLPVPAGRGVARGVHLAERRVRGLADEQARRPQPEVRDHARQPDGPDGRRLPGLPEGRPDDRGLRRLRRGVPAARRPALPARRARDHGGRPHASCSTARAGRRPGAKASASHTASIAGDYAVTRELARAAGVVVAESLADFEDLVRAVHAACATSGPTARGSAPSRTPGSSAWRSPTTSGASTCRRSTPRRPARLEAIYREARIDSVVDVHNPIDLTPMTGDAAYEAVVRAVLEVGRRGRRHRGLRAADGRAQHAASRTRPPRGPHAARTRSRCRLDRG